MSGVPYHAWTHRPKALGGTDPIESEIQWVRRIVIQAITVTAGSQSLVEYEDAGDDTDPSITGSAQWRSFFDIASTSAIRPMLPGFYITVGQYVWENQFAEPRVIELFDGYDYETGFSYVGHASFDEPMGQPFSMPHRYQTISEAHPIQIGLQHGNGSSQDVLVGYTEMWYLGPYTGSDPAHDATGAERPVGEWEE